MSNKPLRAFALVLVPLAFSCSGTREGGDASDAVPDPEPVDSSSFAAIERDIRLRDPDRWMTVMLTDSIVTDGPRRIYFEKEPVTRALLAHGGGVGYDAAPMAYPDGTVFVAERYSRDGVLEDFEVMRLRSGDAPEFLLFDAEGEPLDTFHQPNDPPEGPPPGNVPESCLGCHLGTNYFDPMMSFPSEPEERRIEIDARHRNAPIALRFLEGFHRGENLFGSYGTFLLSSYFADARDATLPAADRGHYDALRARFPEILIFDPDCAATPEAESLLGRSLHRPELTGERKENLEANFDEAWADYVADPADEEALIWTGRRLGYLSRYREAAQVFSRGIELHPESFRLYRHRGHRHISLRRFEQAEADLARAAQLAEDVPDEIEPDGAPNAFGIPTSSNKSSIHYHLGLARYLLRDFEGAEAAYRDCMTFAPTDDMRVATAYWLHMTLQRLGHADAAADVIAPITADMEILENTAYHALILFYKGEISESEVLEGIDPETVQYPTRAYGLGNHRLWNGDVDGAREIFQRIVDGDVWAAFGYIAAETELRELNS